MTIRVKPLLSVALAGALMLFVADNRTVAQVVVSDTLTGASSSYGWRAMEGACLTAGDGTGSIPACVGLPYYNSAPQIGGVSGMLPDPVGRGALRLTNGDAALGEVVSGFQHGAVVSQTPFPSDYGLRVTFTSVTYGGNGLLVTPTFYGHRTDGTGADGISFFLADAAQPISIGAPGGSLGYVCSNDNPSSDGVIGGYLGVGIDEYGNFSNPVDVADTGPAFLPGRISLRGAGSTVYSVLSARYPAYYPASLTAGDRVLAMHATCRTGKVWNYSNPASPVQTNIALDYNYRYMGGQDFPAGFSIANQQGVPAPRRDLALPISYGLNLTQDGLLSMTFSITGGLKQTIINNESITASNGPLPENFRFGFSGGTGAGTNIHEILCFRAAPSQTSSGSATLNQSSRLQIGTQVYLGYYSEINWWGAVTAQNIVQDTSTGAVSIGSTANWDGGCGLTGGMCDTTGSSSTAQGPGDRSIVTYNPASGQGIPFQWSTLGAAQRSALTVGDATVSSARLDYLRGDRSGEVRNGGSFRTRTRVLGDVVNSSPTWVGYPQLPYGGPWRDLLNPGAAALEGTTYQTFAATQATRTNVVYVGSNDGMLHGFRAGAYTASGGFNSTSLNDGRELVAYMPSAVLDTIHSANPSFDYSSPRYAHNAYVDATVGTGDLYYGGAWHTWIAGGLGGGGNAGGVIGDKSSVAKGAFFVLDVTDPSTFSETNAAGLVVTELSSDSTTPCAAGGTNCWANLGSVAGTPLIRRLHNGDWAVIWGNGLNSATGMAGVFIMTVDSSGSRSYRFLSTGRGPSTDGSGAVTARNGIVGVASADLDGDHITDYLYAGDVFGNLWRFDLTSSNAASWSVRAAPLFATGGAPITTRPTVAAVPDDVTGVTRVMIGFGTGQILSQTLTAAAVSASGSQYLIGLWDADLSAWNALGSTTYGSDAGASGTLGLASLQAQTISAGADTTGATGGVRTISANRVCWAGSSTCTGTNDKFGWQVALPGEREQIIYNPVISDGVFVVNTTIPAKEDILACTSQTQGGYTMAISPDTGTALPQSYFQHYVSMEGGTVVGLRFEGVGSPAFVSTGLGRFLVTQTVSGRATGTSVFNPASAGKRLTWAKLR